MLNCKRLVEDADALLAEELAWPRRFSIRMHLFICHHCRRYVKQLRWLIAATPTVHSSASDDEVASVMSRLDERQYSPQPATKDSPSSADTDSH